LIEEEIAAVGLMGDHAQQLKWVCSESRQGRTQTLHAACPIFVQSAD
jgi:hypothetical protein